VSSLLYLGFYSQYLRLFVTHRDLLKIEEPLKDEPWTAEKTAEAVARKKELDQAQKHYNELFQ
jgi:hypothetical protein